MGENILKHENYLTYKRREILQSLMYMEISCTDECIVYVLFKSILLDTRIYFNTIKVLL